MNRTLHSFRRPAALVLVFAAAAMASPGAQERRLITETDLLKFVWIADPQISPDGGTVAFVRVTANEQKDDYETSVWVVPPRAASQPGALTSGTRDTSPRWAPDGRRIVFARSVERDGRAQPPQCICSPSTAAKRGRSPILRAARPRRSGRRTVGASRSPARRGSDDTAPAETTTATPPKKSDVRVITSATYRSNGGGWNDPERPSHLWVDRRAGRAGDTEAAAAHRWHLFGKRPRLVHRWIADLLRLDPHRRSVLPRAGLRCLRRACSRRRDHDESPASTAASATRASRPTAARSPSSARWRHAGAVVQPVRSVRD